MLVWRRDPRKSFYVSQNHHLCLCVWHRGRRSCKISSSSANSINNSRAVKMAASAQRGCQTVRLMADSSATVSSLREAASIFPLVPNEILITNTPLCQYFHGSPEPGASTGRLHDGILGLTYRTSGQVGCNTVNCKHAAPYFYLEMLQALGPPLCTAHSGRAAAPRSVPTDDVAAHLFLPFECVEASTQSAPQ